MKAKYIFIGIALASVMCACNRDEASLFEQSAAERAQTALNTAMDVLTAPENGWEMLYFANPDSRGYNIIVTFDKNGKVTATTKNVMIEYADGNGTKKELLVRNAPANAIVTDSSTWEVINDYGPIMTFNTYNNVLHAWADPRDNGDALLGDYEFLILKAEQNYVKLKSKKHSAYCYLYPLKAGVTDAQYFQEVEDMQSNVFANSNVLRLHFGGKEHMLHKGSTGIFSLTDAGKMPDTEEEDIYPFATRQNGIHLMVPFLTSEDLQFTLKDGKLTSANSSINSIAPAPYVLEYMTLFSGSWVVDISNTCDSIKNTIDVINTKLKEAYPKNKKNASVQGLRIKQTTKNIILVFSYYGSSSKATTDMSYVFDVKREGNSLKLEYLEPADENAQKTLNAFPDIATLFKTLNGSFSLTSEVAINPSKGIKLENQSTSKVWYNISGKL